MNEDMGLTKGDLLQLTASYDANMRALRNRTLAEGKYAWQLMNMVGRVRGPPKDTVAECKADLALHCQAGAEVQNVAMMYGLSSQVGGMVPRAPFTNCSSFGCTCKQEADFYGIGYGDRGFGCTPKGAQDWWVHEATPCASPASCCTVSDYSTKQPPYPGCSPPAAPTAFEQDLVNFLLIRGKYAWLGHGWEGCAQPQADAGGGYPFPPSLNADFGTPLGLCGETATGSGVFQREFTKAKVTMDCGTGIPSIVMKSTSALLYT